MKTSSFAVDARVAIVGMSCRLPGASDPEALWKLLDEGRCAVSRIPEDRWLLPRYLHPRIRERGRSYTWAAGVIDDVWGFDPAVFGISPREAEQMDPQQRLLLELTWEAIEDSGRAPSAIAGSATGVYVGASSLDYANLGTQDVSVIDPYFATGNALSITANRLSYIFDLHGPSFTVDTACSSSLVALHQAVRAISSGEISTALVGGVTILAGPYAFIGFSQATMLSPRGLCHAFSADADGYVRAEGGVVLFLKDLDRAIADRDRIHAVIRATGVNSDGRTSGISLPSKLHQAELLQRIYEGAGLSPDDLAFVEAHGTGTAVGDPVEAGALGTVLGRARTRPLPIGSIKTNIGHTEPTSGLAGMLKAVLALKHDRLPQSLHFAAPNPEIDFEDLNVRVAARPLKLRRSREPRLAGVSSFGFGGTNAHAVIADPPRERRRLVAANPRWLMLSARSEEALKALAGTAAEVFAGDPAEAGRWAAGMVHRRERLPERLVLPLADPAAATTALAAFAGGEAETTAVRATAVAARAEVAFVFSGNGSQWPGMGRAAYDGDAAFRVAFDEVDAIFAPLAGWSLRERMYSETLADELSATSVAQPLIFAIQVAGVRALAARGITPKLVFGHSVGEVAAVHAAGIVDLADAVRVIYFRSLHQEAVRDVGDMSVVIGPRDVAEALAAEVPDLTVAAQNSTRCITVAGTAAALERYGRLAAARKLRVRSLDLRYPFHTPLLAPMEAALRTDLAAMKGRRATIPFVSTVTGDLFSGRRLDGRYWWRNVREPVRFHAGVDKAFELGARIFVEIGAKPTLATHVGDIAEQSGTGIGTVVLLDEKSEGNPIETIAARILAMGADVDTTALFGADPGTGVELPTYPWQRTPMRVKPTCEADGELTETDWHPLAGARISAEAVEWRGFIDPLVVPMLDDHRVGGQVILAGAAFIEMALAVARRWQATTAVALAELEILYPLVFAANGAREILCRISPLTSVLEISSRPRLSGAPFIIHVRAQIVSRADPLDETAPEPLPFDATPGAEIYARARYIGLDFGPSFRRALAAARTTPTTIVVDLEPEETDEPSPWGIDPGRLDSCFHGLILLFEDLAASGSGTYLPVRFGDVRLYRPGVTVARAAITLRRSDARVIVADFALFDADGELVAVLRDARYQAMRLRTGSTAGGTCLLPMLVDVAAPGTPRPTFDVAAVAAAAQAAARDVVGSDDAVLIEGWAVAAAHRFVRDLIGPGGLVRADFADLARIPIRHEAWFSALVHWLERSGLVEAEIDGLRLVDIDLPDPADILRELVATHPERATEALLAARLDGILADTVTGRAVLAPPSTSALAAHGTRSRSAMAAARALAGRLDALAADLPRHDGALRVLLIGHGPAAPVVSTFARTVGARLTLFDTDPVALEHGRLALADHGGLATAGRLEDLADAGFDLVVAADALHRLASPLTLEALLPKFAPGALLMAIESEPSLFRDLVFGLGDGWFDPIERRGALRDAAEWVDACRRAGLVDAAAVSLPTEAEPVSLILAHAPAANELRAHAGRVVVVHDDARPHPLARALHTALLADGAEARLVALGEVGPLEGEQVVFLAGLDGPGDEAERLAARCFALGAVAGAAGTRKLRIHVPLLGGDAPADEGFRAFVRTLGNEMQTLDLRRIGLRDGGDGDVAALVRLLREGSPETDLVFTADGPKALRWVSVDDPDGPTAHAPATAARLEKGAENGFDRLRWVPLERPAPRPGEIEVEIVATGLNFRDVMWSLGMLPDEMLEDGMSGPTLGLEFSGRVVRLGSGVTDFAIGDGVVGFAGGAFATHTLIEAALATRLPAGVSLEAGATIPVAFLTAAWGLIACGRLQAGEWVLIHGGAGGVGLAAVQIAHWLGARVIATAGSPEKRDLLRTLGAEHVFDSRSGTFVDDVRRVTDRKGVAVVLNSLFGEAMERSIGLLAPFGRFVELGKRDYLGNTRIGLRPFRRNLTYYGVDLDQVLVARPDEARRLFLDLIEPFSTGALRPLPHSTFAADDLVEAMRLMQQSGHVGKILLRPPRPERLRRPTGTPFAVDPERTHLVTGGFGGFGLETARWLVARGARHLVLVGRSGASTAEARTKIDELVAAGVTVREVALDITRSKAVAKLFADLARTMPPLAGIWHAAMVLDDAMFANLDLERTLAVLRPKIDGALVLDRLSRGLDLDYFVLFSSATTMIGNPGQASYVAANGWLEGLARRRRAAGLPALAVAWGGIADVGVLARKTAVRDTLAKRAGLKSMTAAASLDLMAEAITRMRDDVDGSVVVIADLAWRVARNHLPLLKSPTFLGLMRGEDGGDAQAREVIDLHELAATKSPEEARKIVVGIVVEEIARILRLPQSSISTTKPLTEIGLDSLMGVELLFALEERFGQRAQITSMASGFNIVDLAGQILSGTQENDGVAAALEDDLVTRHLGRFDPKSVAGLVPQPSPKPKG